MWKVALLLVLLGIAAFLVYHFTRPVPEKVTCDRLAEMCRFDAERKQQCETAMTQVKRSLGEAAVKKMDECTRQSKSCPDAMGCTIGSAFKEGAGELLKGLERAIH